MNQTQIRYMVAKGHSLMDPVHRTQIKEFSEVTPDMYLPSVFADYIKSGYVTEYQERVSPEERKQRLLNSVTVEGLVVSDTPPRPGRPTKWNLDPNTLAEKSLAELNLMIAERDPHVEPFETPAEASAFLSQDF